MIYDDDLKKKVSQEGRMLRRVYGDNAALYGPESRVVGGTSLAGRVSQMTSEIPDIDHGRTTNIEPLPTMAPLGGHKTAVFEQIGSGVVRLPDVMTPAAPASQVQNPLRGRLGVTESRNQAC